MSYRSIINVNTGQIRLAKKDAILRSAALGSCIAVVAYDHTKKIGAIAHIMLPGTAPADHTKKNRYASNAISAILTKMIEAGSQKRDIEACIVGAGNVLKRDDDTICAINIESVTQLLKDNNVPVRASVLGGTERKSVALDIQSGIISYTVGNGKPKLLWKPQDNAE